MQRTHDDNCTKAYKEGNKDLIGDTTSFSKKKAISPHKYEYIPRNATATNVYDDDDRPTSY